MAIVLGKSGGPKYMVGFVLAKKEETKISNDKIVNGKIPIDVEQYTFVSVDDFFEEILRNYPDLPETKEMRKQIIDAMLVHPKLDETLEKFRDKI